MSWSKKLAKRNSLLYWLTAWHRKVSVVGLALCCCFLSARSAQAQAYGSPDRDRPGDEMIQKWLARQAVRLDAQFSNDFKSLSAWQKRLPQLRSEFMEMLGLELDAPRTPLAATVTGTIERDGFIVEKLHYQSRPGLYVTANLYRPAAVASDKRLPAVLYVCGHSGMGRNGNKTAFQTHGMWFARHGYVCLVVDTLQLGEIAAKHHGTYNLERWWWHSRGYTPAGVECWNGVRGIDYLLSRNDVDPERIAVTGISGGGAATFWIAAADERVRVAVPVSGMADLESYLGNRVINGHCDCMFLYNHHAWPWTRIAALIAPRPLLFANSDDDKIFPMDANERISNRLERLYSLYGASDRCDTLVSIGGHAYREDLRRGVFSFINAHLQGTYHRVTDSEVDAKADSDKPTDLPIAPEELRVFADDEDLPRDELNTTIDQHFVAKGKPESPPREDPAAFKAWQGKSIANLRRWAFSALPQRIEPAKIVDDGDPAQLRLSSEEDTWFRLTRDRNPADAKRCVLVVDTQPASQDGETDDPWWYSHVRDDDLVYVCQPRGYGPTEWTRKNPPNFVERAHALLGTTVDTGRVRDIVAAARRLQMLDPKRAEGIQLVGKEAGAVLCGYAAVLEPEAIVSVSLLDPQTSHEHAGSPQFLSVLRVNDIPSSLGLIAPRPLTIRRSSSTGATSDWESVWQMTSECYRAASASGALRLK